MSDPRYGLDTGFFFRLFEGTERARSVWTTIVEGRADGVVSAVSVYELQRNVLNGVLVRDDVEAFLDEEVTHIFTTDHDFTAYEGEPEVEVI